MSRRIFSIVTFIIGLIILPWWLSWPLLVILACLNNSFYEAVALGIIYDLVYGAPVLSAYHYPLIATVICLLTVYLVEELRQSIRIAR